MAKTSFKKTMYVDTYIMASQGNKRKDIAESLGVSYQVFLKWMQKYPALQDAYERGRSDFGKDGKDPNFVDYVYKTLPPKLKKLWNEIHELGKQKKSGEVSKLLKDKGIRVKQQLFIHAFVSRNFNPSRAMQAINLNPSEYSRWLMDPNFKELIEQVHRHRKEFFQECLVKRARKGDTNAIIFANRTLNRDLGYGDKSELEIKGSLNHRHENIVNLSELDLPVELMQQIMMHYRKSKEKQNNVAALEYQQGKDGVFAPVAEEPEHELVSSAED